MQVNGLDVSSCSHEEAVEVLSKASEPIIVEVKHRHSDSNNTNNTAAPSDITKTSDNDNVSKSKCSQESQTDVAQLNNFCDNCGDLYGFNNFNNCDLQSLDPEENFIYPELQYEVILK